MTSEAYGLVQWGFYSLITGCAVVAVKILGEMKTSINSLNERVAKVIEKTSWHEKELDRHDQRLSKLEET